ncbi:cyclase family protein [Vitiosangium sp. GDMCC 1.1324]|uniref:cyclase family protein n=1 Tax=Vitiosangium sp. (strain GDMCC 1.1324) TaxID=2138576 RepID=UPI000D3CFEF1|nr:cyclase family protein [Vitiosangium sp. GDMCC 1.1324]PTL85745.1 cyclase [Vitiosangium sp. GDMCC 1.1324]
MTKRSPLLLLVLPLVVCACATTGPRIPSGEVIDMTHPFDEQTIYWPTAEGFHLQKESFGQTPKGYFYAANSFSAAEHGGTHIDSPIHFAEGHPSVDQIPLEQLMGEAILIDVSRQCAANPDYQISPEDFVGWEKEHGQIPNGAIVLLRTGFGTRWPDRKSYLGTDERGPEAVAKLHFPGLHPDAARWLTGNRSIKAIGLDTASIDYGQSSLFESHRELFAHDIPAFENVANLDRLPASGFVVIAFPMKIKGGSGGPLRIAAILGQRH